MVNLNLEGCAPFIEKSVLDEYLKRALEARKTLLGRKGAGSEFTGWLTLPDDVSEETVSGIENIRREWKAKGVNLVTVIGIGGSYLGAKCAVSALSHQYIQNPDAPRIVFTGNSLSEECIAEMLDLVDCSNTACVVISKSGTTTEPAVAFRLVKSALERKYGKAEAAQRIVAVTDAAKGALKTLSTQEGYRSYVVPDNVGGRFSVLTPVGLIPIALAGYDIRAMLEGAALQRREILESEGADSATLYAAARNLLYRELGKKNEILVSFNPKLRFLSEWWKQLFGESEGKDGKGIFPASLVCTADLHSMGQYVQDGERHIFESVLNVKNSNREVRIEKDPQDLDQLNYLAGKRVEHLNEMARRGTAMAHIDGGVPQIEIIFERIDEKNLGAVFYFFEFACGVSAYMLGVNPFNQPGVEAYKKNMFMLLEKPGYTK
ncbi:MAG: glucose-6-phosphate isomerase [Bacteroidales bacterium]|nr:glucose-6-phosphate isomerase [Bacteroidales bacterium]